MKRFLDKTWTKVVAYFLFLYSLRWLSLIRQALFISSPMKSICKGRLLPGKHCTTVRPIM